MGLLGGLFGEAVKQVSLQLDKPNQVMEEVMNYSEDDKICAQYAMSCLRRSDIQKDKMRALGYMNALKKLLHSDKVSDLDLKFYYDNAVREKNAMIITVLRQELCNRDLMEKEGERYIKKW